MIEKMTRDFVDIRVTWRNRLTDKEMSSLYTKNTYNLSYLINKLLVDSLKMSKQSNEILEKIDIKEALHLQYGDMYSY